MTLAILFSGSEPSSPPKELTFNSVSSSSSISAFSFSGGVVFTVAYLIAADHSGEIRKIDSDGNLIWTNTDNEGQLSKIVLDSSENVYSIGYGFDTDYVVRKINSSGTLVWTYTPVAGSWNGMCLDVDDSGNVYAGFYNGSIVKINSSGTAVWTYTDHSEYPFDVKYDSVNDAIYVAYSDHQTHKINSSGVQVWTYDAVYGDNNLCNLDFDAAGNVYIGTKYYSIIRLDSTGTLDWENNNFETTDESVYFISYDEDNTKVYGTSEGYSTRSLVPSTGAENWSTYSSSQGGVHLTHDSSGNVYVADYYRNKVRKINSSGVQQWAYSATLSPTAAFHDESDGSTYVSLMDYGAPENPGAIIKLNSSGTAVWTYSGFSYGIHEKSLVLPFGIIVTHELEFDDVSSSSSVSAFSFEGGSIILPFDDLSVASSVTIQDMSLIRSLSFSDVSVGVAVDDLTIVDYVPLSFSPVSVGTQVSEQNAGLVLVASIETTLPSFELVSYGGSRIAFETPELNVDITGYTTKTVSFSAQLPALSMDIATGSKIAFSLPLFDFDVDLSTTASAAILGQLPSFLFSSDIASVGTNSFSANFPPLTISLSGTAGIIAELSDILPVFTVEVDAISGAVVAVNANIPALKMTSVLNPAGPSSISASLPSLLSEVLSGEIESEVLRYIKGQIR